MNIKSKKIKLDSLKADDKSLKKQYLKDLRRHKKELIKIAKTAYPWDYGWILDFIVEHLKMMRDYYALGYNVWGLDTDEEDSRLNIANKLIYEYESYLELPLKERQEIADSLGVELNKIEDNIEFIPCDDPKGIITNNKYYDDSIYSEWINMCWDYEKMHYINFFDLLKEKLNYLWD